MSWEQLPPDKTTDVNGFKLAKTLDGAPFTQDVLNGIFAAGLSASNPLALKQTPLAGPVSGSYLPSPDEFNTGAPTAPSKLVSALSSTSFTFTLNGPLWTTNFTAISPLPLPLAVKIDNEIMVVTAIDSNNVCTARRRMFGTSAATHAANANVVPCIGSNDLFYIDSSFPVHIGLLYWGTAAGNTGKIYLPPPAQVSGGGGPTVPAGRDGETHFISVQCTNAQSIEIYAASGTGILPDPIAKGEAIPSPSGEFLFTAGVRFSTQNGNQWKAIVPPAPTMFPFAGDPNSQSFFYKKGGIVQRTDGGAASCLYVKESDSSSDTGWVAK